MDIKNTKDIKNIYIEIGKYLRNIRQTQRYTIADIAEKSGVKPNSIAKYETGKDRIPIDNLLKICDVLKISITDIFSPLDSHNFVYRILKENAEAINIKIKSYSDKILLGSTGKDNYLYDVYDDPSIQFDYICLPKNMDNITFVIKMADDNMFPIIKKNALVGITSDEVFEGQIYLFHFVKQGLIFKRIKQIRPETGIVVLSSDNLMIEPIEMKLSELEQNIQFKEDSKIAEFSDIDKNYIFGKATWIIQEL